MMRHFNLSTVAHAFIQDSAVTKFTEAMCTLVSINKTITSLRFISNVLVDFVFIDAFD